MKAVIENTISRAAARRFYDRLGAGHDLAERYEGRAKGRAVEQLGLAPGQHVLSAGVGTGKEHALIKAAVEPGGVAFGVDVSRVMLGLTRAHTGAPLCAADVRDLPFASSVFDRVFSSYVLDLIPLADLPRVLAELRRVLRPGGRLALVSLTEGVGPASRAVVALWKLVYAVSPVACGGCRPLELARLVSDAGFSDVRREAVVQLGVPSEVLLAAR